MKHGWNTERSPCLSCVQSAARSLVSHPSSLLPSSINFARTTASWCLQFITSLYILSECRAMRKAKTSFRVLLPSLPRVGTADACAKLLSGNIVSKLIREAPPAAHLRGGVWCRQTGHRKPANPEWVLSRHAITLTLSQKEREPFSLSLRLEHHRRQRRKRDDDRSRAAVALRRLGHARRDHCPGCCRRNSVESLLKTSSYQHRFGHAQAMAHAAAPA